MDNFAAFLFYRTKWSERGLSLLSPFLQKIHVALFVKFPRHFPEDLSGYSKRLHFFLHKKVLRDEPEKIAIHRFLYDT